MLVPRVLAGITALAFAFFGLVKVVGVPTAALRMQRERFFETFGIGRQGIRAIGLAEWAGAALLAAFVAGWTPGVAGAAVHAGVTTGAIGFHLRCGEPRDALLATVMLGLSVAILGSFLVG